MNAKSENRGKRSVDEVMRRAAAAGRSRVLFVHESHGNPSELVLRDESEGWLEPSVMISGTLVPERGKRARLPKEVKARPLDSQGKKIAGLFGLDEAEAGGEDALVLVASAKEIFFEVGGERVGPVIKISELASRKEDSE